MSEMMPQRASISIAMKADLLRSDLDVGLVWFVNYAALDPSAVSSKDLDLHGAGMLPADVEQFAHLWLAHSRSIDINHDGVGRPIFVTESFFNGPDIASPAWPVNSHAARLDVSGSEEATAGLRSGDLNSVSLDAYTFNRVVRLPVAEAKSFLGIREELKSAPETLSQWALELAQRGYPGVLGVTEVRPGLYVAQRSHGMPLAVTFKDGELEASSGGGAWGQVAVALCEAGTLTRTDGAPATVPVGTVRTIDPKEIGPSQAVGSNGPVDFSPWDPDSVDQMLRSQGLMVGVPLVDQVEGERRKQLEHEMFAALMDDTVGVEPSQIAQDMVTQGISLRSYPNGLIPHHTVRDGKLCVSKEAVVLGMAKIHLLPPSKQASARRHLLSHMREISASDPDLAASLGNSAHVAGTRNSAPSGVLVGDDPPMAGGL